jgi:hypothetical protein
MTRLSRTAAAATLALASPLFAQTATPPAAPPVPPAPASGTPAATPTAAPPPSAASLAAGKAAFGKVVEGLGGLEKIRSIRDVRTRGRLTAKTPEGDATMEVQSSMIFPDQLVQEVDSPFGRVGMVVTPTTAFLAGPTGAQDLPAGAAEELRRQVRRIPLNLTRLSKDLKLKVAASGQETVGGVETTILDITYDAMKVRWFVDPQTGRILRTAHDGYAADGKPVRMISDYQDYRVVDGLPVAHRLEITSNGERDQTLIIEEYKFNVGVDPKLFVKPTPAPAASEPPHPAHSAPPAAPAATPAPKP